MNCVLLVIPILLFDTCTCMQEIVNLMSVVSGLLDLVACIDERQEDIRLSTVLAHEFKYNFCSA